MHLFWNSYPFVRFTISLILGILLYDSFPDTGFYHPGTGATLIIVYAILILLSKSMGFYKLRTFNGLLGISIFAFLGGYLTQINYYSAPKNHYKRTHERITGFSGTIVNDVYERPNNHRYDVELSLIKTKDSIYQTSGKIHLYVKKDSSVNSPMHYGDVLVVKGGFFPIQSPKNPEEFDYKQYLARQKIYAQSFVDPSQVKIIHQNRGHDILKIAFKTRANASETIDDFISTERENAIVKALLLGIKDQLNNEIKASYAAAGAMHVLAVSGLHVGILFLMIRFLLIRLRNHGVGGKIIFGFLSVIVIWFYAIITGLSPSVLRAATMFSMVALGDAINRDNSIYNSLALAAFVLLLFDPYLIYSVGFQLSFAAVIGIVYLQPKLFQLVNSKYLIINQIWGITCVSIAAQLTTFPLSLYYFNQFPTYFLLTNLIVIPGAFILLVLGVLMLLSNPVLSLLSKFIGSVIGYISWMINESIKYIQHLPISVIDWIYISKVELMLFYVLIAFLFLVIQRRSFKAFASITIVLLTIVSMHAISYKKQESKDLLVFYSVRNSLAIDHIRGLDAKLYVDDTVRIDQLTYHIDPFRCSSHLKPISESNYLLSEHFTCYSGISFGIIGTSRVMIFDSTTFHLEFMRKINTDILVINNEAVKNLEWLEKQFSFEKIVFGKNNSGYYLRKMKKQASEITADVHFLEQEGAMVMEIDK